MTSPGGITAYLKAVLVFMIYHHVQSELIVKPMGVEAVVGGGLTFFNCSTTLSSVEIHWFHYAEGDTKDRSFVYGYDQFYHPYLGRFQMEKNPTTGAYNLIIPSVTIADAGRYECQDDAGRGDKASAELTVLDGNPECRSNIKPEGLIGPNTCGIDPDELYLTCAVQYHGNQPPMMQWKEAGSDNPIAEGVTRNISSNRAIYYLKMEAISRLDGSSFQCVTTRSATSQYNCTSETIIIKGSTSDRQSVIIIICVVVGLVVILITLLLGIKLGRILRGHGLKQGKSTHSKKEEIELLENQEMEKLRKENEQLRMDKERLETKVSELEQQRYNADNARYRTASSLNNVIKTKATETNKAPVTGIAILENSLFVVSKNCRLIEVYDSKTFVFERLVQNQTFTNPLDIAASKEDKFLYVFDRVDASTSVIRKFDAAGTGGKIWTTENDEGRLSSFESNLIACFLTKRIIIEYSPESQTMNTVRLSPGSGFDKIWHALKLTGTHFAVSHSKVEGGGQRVCVVDINGNVLSAFEDAPTINPLNRAHLPVCLAAVGEASLLVADARNRRVLFLGSKLKYEEPPIETDRDQIPVRLCLNETSDRLFVGVNSGDYSNPKGWATGRILIYNITK